MILKFLKQLNFIFSKQEKRQIVFMLFLVVFGGLVELAGVSFIIPFVSALLEPEVLLQNKYLGSLYTFLEVKNLRSFIIVLAGVLVLIYVFKNIYLMLLNYFQFKFTFESQRKLAKKMMESYMNQSYEFHVTNNSVNLMRNVNDDTNQCYTVILSGLQLITEVIMCGMLLIFLLIQDSTITLGTICVFLIYFLLFFKIVKTRIKTYGIKSRDFQVKRNKWLLQAFGGIKECKILNREDFFVNQYNDQAKAYTKVQVIYQLLTYSSKPLLETMCISGILILVSFRIYSGHNLATFIPVLSAFAVAAFRMLPSINKITSALNSMIFYKASIDAVYNDLMEIHKLKGRKNISAISNSNLVFNQKISIRKVSFSYNPSQKNILSQVEIEIPKNKSIAFVGASGAGKTTMIDLILGLFNPQEGAIYCDNIDISEYMEAWQKKIGYIPQNIYLMDDTITNNIAFGIDNKEIDKEKLEVAMKKAQLSEFVSKLPEGLETIIGEGGVRLSGGQRQRIGIARALYNNPEILILDEATSALDGETESAVMNAINLLVGCKTVIIIAHRLSTIEACDIIYKIEDEKATRVNLSELGVEE